MPIRYISADYIFPVASPMMEAGVVVSENGVIKDIAGRTRFADKNIQIYEGILCPGFVNSHCHLELSHFAGCIPEKKGLNQFIIDLMNLSPETRNQKPETRIKSIQKAENEMILNGILAVGDIMNGEWSVSVKKKHNLYYNNLIELFGFDPEKAEQAWSHGNDLYNKCIHELNFFQNTITPHSFYSVSDPLLNKICNSSIQNHHLLSIHNQESKSENEWFQSKSGKMARRFTNWGLNIETFQKTGKSSLVSSLEKLPKTEKLLLVHNTYTSEKDIVMTQKYNADIHWCFCPNANLYIEDKLPDIPLFIKNKSKICIGTDSLASNHSLSILKELKTIQSHYSEINLETLLSWATQNGAIALNLEKKIGSFEKEKSPGINLIKNVNLKEMKFTIDSYVQVLERGKVMVQ